MGRVLVVGEALIDIVHRTDGMVDRHPGGSPLNVAIGLARLGHPVDFATRFAHDAAGDMIRDHLSQEDRIRLMPRSDDAERTSTAAAHLDEGGAATYRFDLTWDVGEVLNDAPVGHVHTGSIAATLQPGARDVLAAVEGARATGTISYDPNARPTIMGEPGSVAAQMERLIAVSDVVKASDEDIAWLYPGEQLAEVTERWAASGPLLVVVTRGGDGASVLVSATGERADVRVGDASVVDTVGAGDSFMAGLISWLLDAALLGGTDARERLATASLTDVLPALQRAAACAAITVSRAGANPPTRAELHESIPRQAGSSTLG